MACLNEVLYQGADELTLETIIQIQLQDAKSYSSKGKQRENDISDEALSFEMQIEELESVSLFLADKRMTQSIASAVQTDAQILTGTLTREDVVARDHELAQTFAEGGDTSITAIWDAAKDQDTQIPDDEFLEKLEILYHQPEQRNAFATRRDQWESSAWAASRGRQRTTTCEACKEIVNFSDVARVPCRHEYCRACLRNLFETSMTDESLFPPRCCRQAMPLSSVRLFLTSELVRNFEKKKIEFETPNRTYCSSSRCSAFICSENVSGDVATCPNCSLRTCTICKSAAHDGDCPNDTGLQQVLDTARQNGWQRCHNCWTLVELEHGCNHMTCRCGAQFCYVCGQRWKTCTCVQWDEHRLLARATQIVDRQREQPHANQRLVQRAQPPLRLGFHPRQQLPQVDATNTWHIPAIENERIQTFNQQFDRRFGDALLGAENQSNENENARSLQERRQAGLFQPSLDIQRAEAPPLNQLRPDIQPAVPQEQAGSVVDALHNEEPPEVHLPEPSSDHLDIQPPPYTEQSSEPQPAQSLPDEELIEPESEQSSMIAQLESSSGLSDEEVQAPADQSPATQYPDRQSASTPPPDSQPQTERELLIAATLQDLREHHECNHDRWRHIQGAHRCEECSHRLQQFILECRQCHLQACNRCRRNRL